MGVSKNNGTSKSTILIGFSIINHPFRGTMGYPYFWKHPCLENHFHQLQPTLQLHQLQVVKWHQPMAIPCAKKPHTRCSSNHFSPKHPPWLIKENNKDAIPISTHTSSISPLHQLTSPLPGGKKKQHLDTCRCPSPMSDKQAPVGRINDFKSRSSGGLR